MTSSQKAAFSLLISVLLFGIFTALAFTGLFDLIEARFYDPSIKASITRDLTRNAEEIDRFMVETRTRFSETLNVPAIRRSFLPNQGASDIFERSRIYGLLSESLIGFQWVRFIDFGGSRLHFSTYAPDIQSQDRLSVAYRNYNEPGFPYEEIAVSEKENPKYFFDEKLDRILFSFPFYDSFDVYKGTALFSLSVKALTDRLISDGRIKAGQELSVISDPKGLLSGTISTGQRVLPSQVSSIWKGSFQETARLVSPSSGLSLLLITVKSSQDFLIGRLVDEELFLFPLTMKIILLASFFLTVYLTIFLLFNLRQDSVTIVQNRLKQLQISLIEQFYERKGDVDWARWSRELEQRRDEISLQLKQGVKLASADNKDIDVLIDKSWDELLSVMGGRSQFASKDAGIDEEKLQVILNRILAALPASGAAAAFSPQPPISQEAYSPGEAAMDKQSETAGADAEELEELEEIETIEELEEAEPENAELVEEAEAVEEVEAVEDAAEDTVEAVEILEDFDAAEETVSIPEPLGVPEPLAAVDVPVIDVVEMNLSAAAADEVVEAISSAEEVEELEELDDLGEAEELESLEEEKQPPAPPPGPDPSSIAKLASQIEFSPENETESFNEMSLGDFEIVSPFSTMLFDFAEADDDLIFLEEDDEGGDDTPAAMLEEVSGPLSNSNEPSGDVKKNQTGKKAKTAGQKRKPDHILSFISKPFFNLGNSEKIETLEALEGDEEEIETVEAVSEDEGIDETIIEEREGVPYINDDVLSQDEDKDPDLNKDFQDLVDSVIK